ncbi:ABC transporter substrate-binding protein [Streptomyces sp. NPDC050388]|uniref:ABC transporter substrate-binding protein n=1 Tax=Streptomyces sp. NPDC050388 TaxID=3155781 RepID=UPI00343D64E1
MSRVRTSTLAILATSTLLAGCAGASPESGDIMIGMSTSTTGAFAAIGEPAVRGAQTAVDEVNKNGGVNGRKIKLQVLDDASDPTRAVANTRRLIADGAVAVLGPGTGNTVPQTVAVTGREKVLHISQIGPNFAEKLPNRSLPETYFGTAGDVALWAQAAFCYAEQVHDARRIAIVHTREATGTLLADAAETFADKAGIKVVETQSVSPDTTTDTSVAWKRVDEAQPDVVLNFMVGAIGGASLKTAKEVGVEAPTIGFISNGQHTVQQLAGEAGHGNITVGHITAEDPASHQEQFVQRFQAKFPDHRADDFAAYGYDSVLLTAEALKKVPGASQKDGPKLVKALEELKFQGVVAHYDFETMKEPSDIFAHAGMSLSDLIFIENVGGTLKRSTEQPTCE